MAWQTSSERLGASMQHSWRHWEESRKALEEGTAPPTPSFTITLSREAGLDASGVVEETAQRLGWAVYDQQLLKRIADELGSQTSSLESVDEKRSSWLREALEHFTATPPVSESSYFRHLVQAILSLAGKGKCIIVGRGAPQLLPPQTTLRIRLVAPLKQRIATVSREQHVSSEEAARRVEKLERERCQFVQDHFHKDVADPANYDLVLNTARFNGKECADLIVEGLLRLQARAQIPETAEV